jgi:hypothetical protein
VPCRRRSRVGLRLWCECDGKLHRIPVEFDATGRWPAAKQGYRSSCTSTKEHSASTLPATGTVARHHRSSVVSSTSTAVSPAAYSASQNASAALSAHTVSPASKSETHIHHRKDQRKSKLSVFDSEEEPRRQTQGIGTSSRLESIERAGFYAKEDGSSLLSKTRVHSCPNHCFICILS